MAEDQPPQSPPPALPRACDLCHSKKIKCDRKDPCNNCKAAEVSCGRSRPKNMSRRPDSVFPGPSIEAIIERISRLENRAAVPDHDQQKTFPSMRQSVHGGIETPQHLNPLNHLKSRNRFSFPTTHADQSTYGEQETSRSINKRKRVDEMEPQLTQRRRASITKQMYPPSPDTDTSISIEARTLIQDELQNGDHRDIEKNRVLESAITFTRHISNSCNVPPALDNFNLDHLVNLDDEQMYPCLEFLHLILNGRGTSLPKSYCLDFFTYMPSTLLESMTLDLINQSVSGQTRLQYLVCVNALAYFFLETMFDGAGESSYKYLLSARQRYGQNALAALHHFSVLAPPSLPLVQALLTGALLMQDMGHAGKSWKLNAAAGNACIALCGGNWSAISSGPLAANHSEISTIVHYCYILDRCLSMNMNRPCSFPQMDFTHAGLVPMDHDKPSQVMMMILLEFAQVQDLIILESLAQANKIGWNEGRSKRAEDLLQSMRRIRLKIDSFRLQPIHRDDFLEGEWLGMDFIYYSIMTTVARLLLRSPDEGNLRQKCLTYARASLTALQKMQSVISRSKSPPSTTISSLFWIIWSYPLCPYFVIFCNVVATKNVEDLKLMQEVAEGLSVLIDTKPSIGEVQRLFTALVDLCRPSVQQIPTTNGYQTQQSYGNHDTAAGRSQTLSSIRQPNGYTDAGAYGTSLDVTVPEDLWIGESDQGLDSLSTESQIWNQDLLSQLFEVNTSIEWFNVDLPQ